MNKKLKLLLIFILTLSCKSSFAGLYSDIETGIKAYNKNDFKLAKEYFIQYQNNTPNDKDGYWWLGKTYLKLNDPDKANENFEKSYNIFTKEKDIDKINFNKDANQNIDDYINMSKAYFEEGNLKEAEFYADMILKLDSKSANALFIKAKITQINGNIELSKKYLNQAIVYDNKFLKTNLAKSLEITSIPKLSKEDCEKFMYESYFSGDIDKAIQYAKNYVLMDKENWDAYNFLAKLYYLNNSNSTALETLEEARKINEKNIESYLLETKINKEKEEKLLLKAYEINPNNQEVLLNLGTYYIRKEDYQNAYKYFSYLITINDGLYEGYAGYILCLIKKGETKEALKYIRQASLLNKYQSELNVLLAHICIYKFKYNEALEYIEESLKKEENLNYYLTKAEIYYDLKKYNDSIENLDKINGLIDKDSINRLYMLNFIKLKDYKKLEDYVTLKDSFIDKNSLIYKYGLYKIYQSNGNRNQEKFLYLKIFKSKPSSIKDYVDLSEIVFYERNKEEAVRLLEAAIRQNKDIFNELNHQKNRIKFIATIN